MNAALELLVNINTLIPKQKLIFFCSCEPQNNQCCITICFSLDSLVVNVLKNGPKFLEILAIREDSFSNFDGLKDSKISNLSL
jgi:hypothetical protein